MPVSVGKLFLGGPALSSSLSIHLKINLYHPKVEMYMEKDDFVQVYPQISETTASVPHCSQPKISDRYLRDNTTFLALRQPCSVLAPIVTFTCNIDTFSSLKSR